MLEQNPLYEANIHKKISQTEDFCHRLLYHPSAKYSVPKEPFRDIPCLSPKHHPPKVGLSKNEGIARLLHDLATIELQAMELGLRTLIEFPNESTLFREQLVDIVRDENKHLKLCLEAIDSLGFHWGDWPTHNVLWHATSPKDSLLDRILIVHNFLEGSGLDASDKIQARLFHCKHKPTLYAVKTIIKEELEHVRFGTQWYIKNCNIEKLDPNKDFHTRLFKLKDQLPRRLEKLNYKIRKQAGFSDENLKSLEELQDLQRTL